MMLMMALTQPTSGQAGVPQPEKTAGYITVAPSLVGVGQTLTCNAWVLPLPTTNNYNPYFRGFYNVEVTFVRPDGTKDTFMPVDGTGVYGPGQLSSLGSMFFFYKPTMAGNWSVSFTMPAQNITDSSGTVQYLGCTSNTFYFAVQSDTVLAGLLNGYPWAELPNANVYWSYPINSNNREWTQISGDWTGITNVAPTVNSPTCLHAQPYGLGPNTAHIVWTNVYKEGGIIGGSYGSLSYMGGTGISSSRNSYVIMDGMVFTNIPNTNPAQFVCIDESSGKVLYQAEGSAPFGLHMPGNTYAQATAAQGDAPVLLESSVGSYQQPYLFSSSGGNYNYYDPFTGNLVRTIVNASSARLIDGTVLAFGAGTITGQTARYVYGWNMTSVVNNNWPTGITWKVPLPTTLTGAYPSLFAVSSDVSVVVVGTKNEYWGYNADTGAQLWHIALTYPITSNEEIQLANVDDFIVWDATAATWHCYSITTGAELWETPSVASSPWASTWTVYYGETNDLNNVYFACPDGAMRAYSLTDGHLLWTSTPIPSTEYANNVIPFVSGGLVLVDNKLYVYGGYSLGYCIDPIPRHAMTVCIDATNGDTIFTLNGGVSPNAAANGYVIGFGVYDGTTYCLGKGKTSTTVTAQQQVGGSVLIQGSVLDQSAAQPNTPAISDADMSVWMDYTHMQNSTLLNTPPACNGVPVSLDALDTNGNYIHIGDTTSDVSGIFMYQWTPTTPGLYKVYATFSGSDSYYSSYAETGATVSNAPASSPTPTSIAQSSVSNSDMLMYLAISTIAIIIAIALVGTLLLRKK